MPWRIDNARNLKGARFEHQIYQAPSPTWDHEHCTACWDKILPNDPAYHTPTLNFWICPTCFAELRAELHWSIARSSTPPTH